MKAFLFALLFIVSNVFAMPYTVPLQGLVGGKDTLVILDDLESKSLYSSFFEVLSSRGHKLTLVNSNSVELRLKNFGEYLFDNVIFFAPTTDKLGGISFEDLVEFSNDGGNLILAVNRDVSDSVRDFVEVLGFSVHKKNSEIIDHFAFDDVLDSSLKHVKILTKSVVQSAPILGSYLKKETKPVLFYGVGLNSGRESVLKIDILKGNPTTYSANPSKSLSDTTDENNFQPVLVGAIQGRNNARIVVSGSIDMFSNSFFYSRSNSSDNKIFCSELSRWALGESGVLRFRDIVHHKSDGSPPDVILHEKTRPDLPISLYPDPEITRNSLVYRIKDTIVYSMLVEQLVDNIWVPFQADDMQMEFVMLDPYVRKTMIPDKRTGRLVAEFVAPDSYGIFKFRVLYRRVGFSVLHAETQVSIRPFKHNEYDRFITSAYPYYSSALSAVVAFFVFALFFLFSSDQKK